LKDSSKEPQEAINSGRELPAERFYRFGTFHLDSREHQLLREGEPASLTPRVFELLLLLVRNPGRLLTKQELLEALWGEVAVEESNLAQNVFVLRKALGDGGEPHRWIETVPRVGYRFIGDVTVSRDAAPMATGPREAPAPTDRLPSTKTLAPSRGAGSRRLPWLWLVGALAVAAVALWARLRSPRLPEPPALHRVGSSGRDHSPDASADGRTIAYVSDRDGLSRIWLTHPSSGSEAALTSGPDERPRISPDGASVLFLRDEGDRGSLYRCPTLGGEPRRVLPDATDGDWSPDGRQIVFTRSGKQQDLVWSALGIAAADGGDPHELIRVVGNTLDSPRWAPDGGLIAARKAGASTGVLDSILVIQPDGAKKRFLTILDPPGRISSLAWSGEEAALVYAESESLVSTRAGASTRVVVQHPDSGDARILFWVPEIVGALDVVGPGRLIFDSRSTLENLKETALPGGPRAGVSDATWLTRGRSNDRQPVYTSDGQEVVFSSDRSSNVNLWAVSTKTGSLRRLTDDAANDWDPCFALSTRNLLWSSNRSGSFEIWMAEADGTGARQITHDGLDAENPGATPDGQWIVYGSANPGKTGVWKVRPDGRDARRLTAGAAIWPEVSPDGQYVAFRNAPYDFPSPATGRVTLRVVRVADGGDTGFEIQLKDGLSAGRSRWMTGGRAIAFISRDDRGVNGVFVQDFEPGRDTATSRRSLAGFDPTGAAESFGISPDGSRITIATRQQLSNLVIADRVTGIRKRP
jgi:Tol biopolymer transport system component/DNA-binding winged helix-turn-helix (wHTH) protein